jgi:cellulose synthase (UDP-forming)
MGVFALWWFRPEHWPQSFHGLLGNCVDVVLFSLVSYVVWYPIILQIFSWLICYQIKDPTYKTPPTGLRVAFITTFVPQSEPMELLHQCLPALVDADYPHDTWLLDEGDLPEVRNLCFRLGVKHFSRHGIDDYNMAAGKFLRKTKGGNHNSWYDRHGHNYDIVAQLDTDFIPEPNFLTRTLGYFNDPDVGFVVTPQIYGNTGESVIAQGAAEQAFNFYGPILRGFSGIECSVMIGANHVVRVKALAQVNHYSAHITEDVLTGMKLHANSWKSVYVPEVLAVGEGPATWHAYFIQQMRWAYGSIDVLLRHSPRLLKNMNVFKAVSYVLLMQYYFSGLAMAIGLLGIGLYAAFGIPTTRVDIAQFLEFYIPMLLLCELMSLFMQKFNIRPHAEKGLLLAGRVMNVAAWPFFFLALLGVLSGRRLVYHVTPKAEPISSSSSLKPFTAHLAIGAYCLACILLAIIDHHRSPMMIFWLALSAAIMFGIPYIVPIHDYFTISVAQRPKVENREADVVLK